MYRMALKPTRRSGSTLSLANAAPRGYSVNCRIPNRAEKISKNQNGASNQPHKGMAKASKQIALMRINLTRLMRSASHPTGHWASTPAATDTATNKAACSLLKCTRTAYTGANP